jgi:hypothetical protein
VEFFKLLPTNGMEPVWRGDCGQASHLNNLRDRLERGDCQSQ